MIIVQTQDAQFYPDSQVLRVPYRNVSSSIQGANSKRLKSALLINVTSEEEVEAELQAFEFERQMQVQQRGFDGPLTKPLTLIQAPVDTPLFAEGFSPWGTFTVAVPDQLIEEGEAAQSLQTYVERGLEATANIQRALDGELDEQKAYADTFGDMSLEDAKRQVREQRNVEGAVAV